MENEEMIKKETREACHFDEVYETKIEFEKMISECVWWCKQDNKKRKDEKCWVELYPKLTVFCLLSNCK